MGEKFHFFQIGLLIFFGLLAVVGVIILATHKNTGDATTITAPVVIWGPPIGDEVVQKVIEEKKLEDDSFDKVSYVEKNPNTLLAELLEAIAIGEGPDVILFDSSQLLPLKNKLKPISYTELPLSTYQERYIEGANIFALAEGIYALPLFVDPLVLYWNKDIFASEGVLQVPKTWDGVVQLTSRFSKILQNGDLTQGTIAFGEYENVLHTKEILSSLFMQTGASIVYQDRERKMFVTDLGTNSGKNEQMLALKFFTSFSDSNKVVYSWNKTFDRSREAFAANKVALYGGFVSEVDILSEINPNLNFGMAVWPQLKNANSSLTFGRFYGFGILNSSKNSTQALYVAGVLSGNMMASRISEMASTLSVRKDVLSSLSDEDPFENTKLQSALIAHAWFEPTPKTDLEKVFSRVVNGVVSGSFTADVGVDQIGKDIGVLLKPFNQ